MSSITVLTREDVVFVVTSMWDLIPIRLEECKYQGSQEKKTINISFILILHYTNFTLLRYATGTIARSYRPGQTIEVQIDLVAHHLVR